MSNGTVSVISREWLTMEETTAKLGKSPKTVERLVAAGLLSSRLEPRDGRKPQRLYGAGDVERIKEQAIAAPASSSPPATKALAPRASTQLAIAPDTVTTLRDTVTEWLNRPERISVREKYWLSLDEAAALSGLARNDLLALCRAGKLNARKSGGWKIRRKSLEEFTG